jgi:hypothetical protein
MTNPTAPAAPPLNEPCSICGALIQDPWGDNAWPVNEGRCCSDCNSTRVIPARLGAILNR